MSGHSHWSQVKHKKAASDIKKGQVRSKLMNGIYVALRDGSNPETNIKLRTAIDRARNFGIGQDTIERALNKPEKTNIEEVIYEIYGPSGTAFLISAQTDNKNRTTGEIKHLISSYGKLAEPGSVSWMFEEKGVVETSKDLFNEAWIDDLVNSGLEDFKETTDDNGSKLMMFICDSKNIFTLKRAIELKGGVVESAETQFLPKTLINIDNETKEKLKQFIEKVLDHQDISAIYSNFE